MHGQAIGFVQHHHVVVFEQGDGFQIGAGLEFFRRVLAQLRRLGFERGNAHALAGLQAVLRMHAPPAHTQLAFADHPLDMAERQTRKPCFQEAVNAHAVFVFGDDNILHAASKPRPAPAALHGSQRAVAPLHDPLTDGACQSFFRPRRAQSPHAGERTKACRVRGPRPVPPRCAI